MYLQGKDLIIKIDGNAVAAAKSCQLQTSCDLIEISTPTSGEWREFDAGRKSWEVACSTLVMDIVGFVLGNGERVQLTFTLGGPTYTFAGTTWGNVSENRIIDPEGIYYDASGNRFVAKKDGTYYAYWSYSGQSAETYFVHPVRGATYKDNTTDYIYYYNGIKLHRFTQFTGNAICKGTGVQASVGSMAQGSFSFRGTGSLTMVDQ